MNSDPQEPNDLKSYHIASTDIPQRSIPQSGDKEEGAAIGIGIGAVYVWAVYGVAFASGSAFFWAVFGVAYSLGLAWLAERYPPKHLAWGMLGFNPGWGILLSFAINDLPDILHGNDIRVGVLVVIPVTIFLGWRGLY